MRDIIVLGGTTHPHLTRLISRNLTVDQGVVDVKKFSNGETSVEIRDSVREKDVFIVQSGCGEVNDNFMELLITIAACKTASAKRVTAVLPLFPYSRQPDVPHAANLTGAPLITFRRDTFSSPGTPGTPGTPKLLKIDREFDFNSTDSTPNPFFNKLKATSIMTNTSAVNFATIQNLPDVDIFGKTESGYKQWIAQNGTLIAHLLTTAGADRLITMDLHDAQFQGFFDIPVDNLYSKPLMKRYITDYIPNYRDCVIVSPDSGGAKRATNIADLLGCSFALIHKERRAKISKNPPSGHVEGSSYGNSSPLMTSSSSINTLNNQSMVATTMLVGEVKDKVCVLVDDLVDTAYTITRAANLLKDQGATKVYVLVTHGIFSGDALNRINKSAIDKVITTNSVPQTGIQVLGPKLEVLDISKILAESIRRIHNGESVSMIFDHGW